MGSASKIAVAVLILFCSQLTFSQQLRLGKNPYAVEKSAVLELYSDNQGLLLPRITDTSLINTLSPPDGMTIYFVPTQQVLIRANSYWQKISTTGSVVTSLNGNVGALTMDTGYIANFSQKVRSLFSGTAPITYSNGLIGITQATTSTNGYLSSTDWNAFNNKLSSIDTTNISNFYLKVRSLFSGTAPITYSNGLIGITQATTSTNGYLSSADWNTFNNKAASFTKGNLTETGSGILTITGGTNSVIGTGTTIQVKQATTTQSGYLSNADWNTFNNKLSSIDTTNISNFYVKVRSLFSATAPITYSNGLVGITQATTSTNGYLSSTDWNTFNNKVSSSNVWLLAGNSGTNPATNFIGTTDNQDLVFKTNNTEWARIVASSGDIKIGSATSGTIRSTDELVMRQDGDTYGSSILRLRNRTAENGAIFETTDATTTLVDFIFKTAASQRNIRYEARSTYARAGTPSFHIGGASPDNPTLAVGDSYAAFNTNLKIGNYNTPTEALDVTGNVRFSGALMPNNAAGTSGQILTSGGSGASPTWITALPIANGGTGQTTANAALNALLPTQTGNTGQVLTTDGTNTNWQETENTALLTSDVVNNNFTANSIANVTGLSFNVTAGNTYKFRFVIAYTAASTTTGSRWSINGPATTFLYYHSSYSLTTVSTTQNEGLSSYNVPASCNATSAATGSNIAIIEGTIRPSANGTVIARFASGVSSSAITAKTGSYVEYKKLN